MHASRQSSSSTALSRGWALASDAGGPVGGYGNRNSSGNSTSVSVTNTAVGTTVSAGSLEMTSGGDIKLQAATVVADGDIAITAGRSLTIESAQSTHMGLDSTASARSGFIGTWKAPGVGNVKGFDANSSASTTQESSQIASLSGNVTLVAGTEYRQTASSVLAAGQRGTLQGGDVSILAKNVTIDEAYNTEQSVGVRRGSSTTLGGSASVGAFGLNVSTNDLLGGGSGSLGQVRNTVQAMGETNNSRAQALGALNLAMTGKQVYDGVSKLAGDASASSTLTYGVSVSLGRNESHGINASNGTTAVGSSVMGANNVSIVALGGGAGSNIHAVGSNIAAGNTVDLAADNDIILEASRSTAVSAGNSAGHGESIGATLGAGAQSGLSFQVGVQSSRGRDNQDSITYTPTQVSGGKAANVSSGRNLTLNGATIEGERVSTHVGGDLNITTLQDVSVGRSRQSSGGFGLSICVPPICEGAIVLPSANVAGASADGAYVSPGTQSGIMAGNGGFDVNVAGSTRLTGAVIESTQAAIDANRNSFHTGGTLTTADLQNLSQSSGNAYSASASLPIGYGTQPTDTQDAQIGWTAPRDANGNSTARPGSTQPTGSAGVGSHGSSQTSTTISGISGIAGDTAVRTGNAASAGTLVHDWNSQAILSDVQAQARIAQQFNQQATTAWGQYANGRYDDALNAHDDEAAACWAANGACRAAGHAVIGGLGSGVDGAIGAVASTQVAPLVDRAVTALGLTGTAHDAVVVGLTAAVGGALGGTSGAAGAFNEVTNNYLTLSDLAQKNAELAACKGDPGCEKAIRAKWDQVSIHRNSEYLASCTTGTPQQCRANLIRLAQDLSLLQGNGTGTGSSPYTPEERNNIKQVGVLIRTELETLYATGAQAIGQTNPSPQTLADQGYLTQAEATALMATRANTMSDVVVATLANLLTTGTTAARGMAQAESLPPGTSRVTNAGGEVIGTLNPDGTVTLNTAGTTSRMAQAELSTISNAAAAATENIGTVANARAAQQTIASASAAGRTVSTMADALSGDAIAATQSGTIRGADICTTGCAIGGLNTQEQQLVTRIRNREDARGALTEQLLESVSTRTGMTVLSGGKYGGNNGFDLVLQDAAGNVTIILDAKQITQAGSIRVSLDGAGGATQLSPQWLLNVLGRIDQNSPAYAAIQNARQSNTLTMAVGGVNRNSGELIIAPVTVPNRKNSR